ncbi:MAG: threonine synthase [Dehalococcoidia bacterium]|nr:threonine synthase [Dehalococcoidia bacterium]
MKTLSTLTHLECSICGERHDAEVVQTICTSCGRALVARYDLDAAKRTFTREAIGQRVASMWRYEELMPIREHEHLFSLGEGMTALLPTPRLGELVGASDLWVKDEGSNPTGTFKARGISAALSRAVELGVTEVGMPTAGNAGSATAAYAARAGIAAHVAMPADTPVAMMDEVRTFGASLKLIDGLISDAGAWVAEQSAANGWFPMSTLKEPYRVEGKKTMGLELWEQFDGVLPDAILYPTGGGTGLIGMWKAFDELEAMGLLGSERPRMVVVQSEGCAPIVRAFEAGADRAEPWENAATIAPGIRVPVAFADDLILQAVRASEGDAITVGDDEIRSAILDVTRSEGIDVCPEGAATLAGLRKLIAEQRIDAGSRIVLFNTGTGMKHPELRVTA